MTCLNITVADSWFFKESRPMGSIGANEMASVFPPTPYTMSGVIRSMIGENANLNWQDYRQGNNAEFNKLIGNPKKENDLGKLNLIGTFIANKNGTLVPIPLNLVQETNSTNLHFLQISNKTYLTDLGKTKLPELPKNIVSAKPLEQHWINIKGLEQLLSGNLPAKNSIFSLNNLITKDPRLGIAIDNKTRTAKESQLYQTNHIRLKSNISLHQFMDGIEPKNLPNKTIENRFGAEGRVANIAIEANQLSIPKPQNFKQAKGLVIYFLSHANFKSNWYPENFTKKVTSSEQVIWQGKINDIEITIESCIIGKSLREGGWDIAKHQPKPAPEMIPAGSVWYITTDEPLDKVTDALHQTHIGEETQLGRGLIVCGLWK